MASSVVQIRVDEQLRNEAAEVYERLGIDIPTAVRMFLKRSVLDNGIPFAMTLPKEDFIMSKAVQALDEIQESTMASGAADMTLDEINAEITDARRTGGGRG
ncbi:MAG: type II toxin-antitoxin system RelB/DinJ family antitoxin [Lachnospiraceae bacterium]|nr:type II toxin-antitoxin system RelB/DinJ family antitoxin [Lachnospiraceae bacterium]